MVQAKRNVDAETQSLLSAMEMFKEYVIKLFMELKKAQTGNTQLASFHLFEMMENATPTHYLHWERHKEPQTKQHWVMAKSRNVQMGSQIQPREEKRKEEPSGKVHTPALKEKRKEQWCDCLIAWYIDGQDDGYSIGAMDRDACEADPRCDLCHLRRPNNPP